MIYSEEELRQFERLQKATPAKPRWRGSKVGYRIDYAHYRKRKRFQAFKVGVLSRLTRPKDDREWRFVFYYVAGVLRAASENGMRVTQKARAAAATAAVPLAGYPEKRDFTQRNKAEDLMGLPRIQQGVADAFAAVGVDLVKCGKVLGNILDAKLETTIEYAKEDGRRIETSSGVSAADQLRAVDLYFRVTHGFATTKTASVNVNKNVDRFFDPDRNAAPGAPVLTIDQEAD